MIRIKKYGNRRLYDTEQSRYVNLEDLVAMIREGAELQVVDAKTGADLTREVLLQVLLEVQGGQALLPVGLLHRIIRYSGEGPASGVALRQLGAGLELLDAQLVQIERQFGFMARKPRTSARAPEPPPEEPEDEPGERGPEKGEKNEKGEKREKREKNGKEPEQAEKSPKGETADPKKEGEELDALRARLAALEGRLRR